MEELTLEQTLSELVMRFPAASYLFEKYDLDYCCHGNKTLYEACEGDLKKYGRVKNALDDVFERAGKGSNFVHFGNMEIPELVDYIYSRHHSYVKEAMPIIHEHLKKVSVKHGGNHPELNEVFRLFQEMEHEMNQHILREEQI